MRRGQPVLVLAADLFEDMELLYPVYRLREEGIDVTIAGLTTDEVTGKKGRGPVGWVPISAKIIKGRRATSVSAIRDDMVNPGADWVDEPCVVDGNLISARTRPTWARG